MGATLARSEEEEKCCFKGLCFKGEVEPSLNPKRKSVNHCRLGRDHNATRRLFGQL
jgi:hypothetical protein